MKLFWTLALAAVVTVSLSGCLDDAVEPVQLQDMQHTIMPLPEPAQIVEPAAVLPVDVPVAPEVPVVTPPPVEPVTPPTVPEPVAVDPFAEWMKNPTFTCEPGRAPGWLNEQGVPTSCVAN